MLRLVCVGSLILMLAANWAEYVTPGVHKSGAIKFLYWSAKYLWVFSMELQLSGAQNFEVFRRFLENVRKFAFDRPRHVGFWRQKNLWRCNFSVCGAGL